MKLEVKNLDYSYGSKPAVDNVSINVRDGEFVGLIGPNGSGKSTVLKNIYRALTPDRGEIYIDGEDLLKMSYKESALRMAVVGQENDVPFNFRVEEIVAMGRTPHKKMFDIDTKEDKEIIRQFDEALAANAKLGRADSSFTKRFGYNLLLSKVFVDFGLEKTMI